MSYKVEREFGGKLLTLKTGDLAMQAGSAVTVSYGDTVVLVTACMAKEPREGVDFLPLTIDYEERLYAAGKIPGSFFRREGRPTQHATLASRLTDRPLRPLFPKGFRHETQIIITVLSADQENSPEVLGLIGASTALCISEIPFEGPIGAVRVGYIKGEFLVNPTFSQLQESLIDLVVVGTKEAIVMVEAGAQEVSEKLIMEGIKFGQRINQDVISLQEQLVNTCGKTKVNFQMTAVNSELESAVSAALGSKLSEVFGKGKIERDQAISTLKEELLEKLGDKYSRQETLSSFEAKLKAGLRVNILQKGLRPDGRHLTEIRPLECAVGLLPRTHGSGMFSRGLTQVLNIATLGSTREEQHLDGLSAEESKRFMHHYNFPPYSTGEVKRIGTPGRREVGHGALVEKALSAVVPPEDDFPYTIRLVSEVLSSNGSTSMASVCAATLSLMDAGIPIKAPVAGIAMGLVTGENGEFAVVTDLEGMEDAYGDMDFKVAGTAAGITALQLDTKLKGLSHEILEKALSDAHQARLFILTAMQKTIATSRPELSKYAPRMIKLSIDPSKIGSVIGPGGKTIRSIIEQTKTTIDIENDGTVLIGSIDPEAAQKAIAMVENLTRDIEVNSIYTGKVTRIFGYGALVEILPGKEGLVHISELADYRVPSVEEVVKVGDEIMVKVIDLDRQGKISLSRRAVFQESTQATSEPNQGSSSAPTWPHTPRRRPDGTEGKSPDSRRYHRPRS
ncbi:MAG: polyribonucleotide nucleotidyltransferase [Chloroflexi bacterium RBG_13_53_26]|nr:MAG: polyribonucleotide nucleotidyltransferase [Chloroflexi bacterium RBG_13_53_26]